MRRIIPILAAILLMTVLTVSVQAAEASNTAGFYATVASDGSCQVTMTATVHLDQAIPSLTYPIPAEAGNITVNGARVRTRTVGGAKQIDLSGIVGSMAGDFTLNIGYQLPEVVKITETRLMQLELPMLSGFAYPTETMEFSVTFPGEVTGAPAFSSGYYQSSIEQDISYQVSGATVTGSTTAVLKDHETLLMTFPVTREMFPTVGVAEAVFTPNSTWMLVLVGAAVLYWILFLRFWVNPFFESNSAVPDGCGAGQLRSVLHLQGADLTLMVMQWAQLGYVTVRIKGKTRIIRRMDMGNERSEFEQKVFRNLFKKKDTVECESLAYVEQCRKTAAMAGSRQNFVKRRSGNPKIYRALLALAALAGGASLGLALANGGALRVFIAVVLGIAGGISGWYLQGWAQDFFLLPADKPWGRVAVSAVWLVLGIAAGQFVLALALVASQILLGILGAFGGRRTVWGRAQFIQIFSLRRYLRTASPAELERISKINPEYFYTLAPYAMALGVGKRFASRFGRMQLPPCTYLELPKQEESMTPAQWMQRMLYARQKMDARYRGFRKERILRILRSLHG